MFAYAASVDVNPPGATPVLTADQVWRGLVMKAENAVPFVPAMSSCAVLERWADGLLREVVNDGKTFREKITFTPPVQVRFERLDSPEHAGWITNVISESSRGLLVTFTFAVRLPGVASDSDEEQRAGAAMKARYVGAIEATLKTVRRLVADGKL